MIRMSGHYSKKLFLISAAFFFLLSVFGVIIFECDNILPRKAADSIYTVIMLICPFHAIAFSITIYAQNVFILKSHYVLIVISAIFLIWLLIIIPVLLVKKFQKLKVLVVKALIGIDIFYHAVLIVAGILPSTFWELAFLGIIAVLADILILILALNVKGTGGQGDGSVVLQN